MHTFVLAALVIAPVADRDERDPLAEGWRWRTFNRANGLPSNVVLCFHETREGLLVAGLDRGICTYDGYAWREIPCEGDSVSRVIRLASSRDGRLYAASQKEVWCREGSGPFRRVHDGDDIYIAGSPASGAVYCFDRGRLHLFDTGGRLLPQETTPAFGEQDVEDLAVAEDGTIWAATALGLLRLDPKTGEWQSPEGLAAIGFDRAPAFRIFPVPGAGLWVVVGRTGEGRAVVRADEEGWTIPEEGAPERLVVALEATTDGEVYASTMDGGLFHRREGRWRFLPRVGPGAVVVTAILRDSDGAVWFSFSGLGVARFSPLSRRWRSYRAGLGLPGNRVLSLVEARDGSIWAGTQSGVYRFLEGNVEAFREAGGVELAHITGLAEDRHGGIWASSGATFDGALRHKDGVWTRFGLTSGLVTYRVHRITRDRQGNLWFATLGPRPGAGPETGAWMYDGIRFRLIGPEQGLVDGRVYDVYQATDGSYWFATWGGLGHLTKLDGGAWETFTAREGLASDRVWAVSEGPDGAIWVSYQIYGGGVSRYRGGRWTNYRTSEGLINDNVWSIATTADGDVWFGTEGGISRFDGFAFFSYPVAEEPFFSNVWPLAPAREGSILVGTLSSGIYRFRRDDVDPPRVLGPTDLGPADMGPAGMGIEVDLPWTLQWDARDYGDWTPPEDLLFRTRIDEGEWSAFRKGNRLVLRDLPPGLRRIEIQARDRDGNTSEPCIFSVRVRAGLWRRPESIAVVAAVAVAATLLGLWGLARYRQERTLRDRYRAALREAAGAVLVVDPEGRITESLGPDPSALPARGDRIQDLARGGQDRVADLLKGIPADGIALAGDHGEGWIARGVPLPQGGAALYLEPEEALRRRTWKERVDRIERILALARAQGNPDPEAGVEASAGSPSLRPVAPADLIERIARELEADAPAARFHLPDPIGLWNLWGDPRDIQTLLREILRNAAEASGAEPIVVRARNLSRIGESDIGVEVTIDDRGPGIAGGLQDRLFEPFFTTKESHRGLGLFRALRAAVRSGGSITIESTPGLGTSVVIVIPATKEPVQPEDARVGGTHE